MQDPLLPFIDAIDLNLVSFFSQESRRSYGDLSRQGRTASSDQLINRPFWCRLDVQSHGLITIIIPDTCDRVPSQPHPLHFILSSPPGLCTYFIMCDSERICGLVTVFIASIIVKVKYDTIFCVGCYKGHLMMMYFFG